MVGIVEKIVNGGWGIVRDNNKVVFLNYVLPGETVEYLIKDKAKGIYWGEVTKIIKKSKYRKTPECNLYGKCGGCVFQHIKYDYQKTLKTEIFLDDMRRIGGHEVKIKNFFESPPYAYRIRGRLKAENSGKIGFIKKGTHHIIPLKHCLLFSEEMNQYLLKWNSQENPPFFFQQDILLNKNSEKNILSYLSHPPTENQIKKLSSFKSTDYSWKNNNTLSMSLKTKEFEYRIKPSTFFQVNKFQFDNMLQYVENNLSQSEQAIDLYSGVGFFIPLLLKYSKKVIGVESYPESVKLAKQSFPKAEFINKNVDKFRFIHADMVLADPPRSGLSPYVIKNILKFKYKKLIYISCSSASYARDSKILRENGYKIDNISLIDLFPQTPHIEILSVFKLNNEQ